MIRSKFVQFAGVTLLTVLSEVADRWISDLETTFDLSSKMKARLAICIANLVEDSIDRTNQYFH